MWYFEPDNYESKYETSHFAPRSNIILTMRSLGTSTLVGNAVSYVNQGNIVRSNKNTGRTGPQPKLLGVS